MNLFIVKTWIETKLAADERGANMVEYILLIAFIALVAFVAVQALGNNVSGKFSSASQSLG